MARFAQGGVGTFEASRFCAGRKNYQRFEINGSNGSLAFDLERMNELEFFDRTDPAHAQGFRTITATDGCHPYAGNYWPAAHIIGYEHTFINLLADLLKAIAEGKAATPNWVDGVKNQAVLEAVEKSSAARGWVTPEA
jgi:predicted dehydrogenase